MPLAVMQEDFLISFYAFSRVFILTNAHTNDKTNVDIPNRAVRATIK